MKFGQAAWENVRASGRRSLQKWVREAVLPPPHGPLTCTCYGKTNSKIKELIAGKAG